MSHQISSGNGEKKIRELPVLSKEKREFPTREKQPPLTTTEENGDVIFRFKLDMSNSSVDQTLEDFYRASIRDLLKVVRFYAQGAPVIVDSFAFLNRPHQQLKIVDQDQP
jgi:hypothetical protein